MLQEMGGERMEIHLFPSCPSLLGRELMTWPFLDVTRSWEGQPWEGQLLSRDNSTRWKGEDGEVWQIAICLWTNSLSL